MCLFPEIHFLLLISLIWIFMTFPLYRSFTLFGCKQVTLNLSETLNCHTEFWQNYCGLAAACLSIAMGTGKVRSNCYSAVDSLYVLDRSSACPPSFYSHSWAGNQQSSSQTIRSWHFYAVTCFSGLCCFYFRGGGVLTNLIRVLWKLFSYCSKYFED